MTNPIEALIKRIARALGKSNTDFAGSEEYWKQRYVRNGNSGAGSYNKLAEFKAEILNEFVLENNVGSVIEYGSGDGNQLKLARYPKYIGFDISPIAIEKCRSIFLNDTSKTFKLTDEYSNEKANLTLSLDVIYHLVENNVFSNYMQQLFESSNRFVIIYASNTDKQRINQSPHVLHRNFTLWIEENEPNWKLIKHIPNKYPYNGDDNEGSFADFFIYKSISAT